MTNDIIGSFGIIILAIVLAVFVSRSDNMDMLWWGNLGQNNTVESSMDQFRSEEELVENEPETTVKGSRVVVEYTQVDENCTTSCKIDWKKMPPIPYLFEQLEEKYGKKFILEHQIGQYFLWPQNKNKFTNVTNADAVIIEYVHDPSGKTANDQRSQITKILKKLGFSKVNKSECLITGGYDFADCLDYYERGNYRCMSMMIYAPIDKMDVEKVEGKVVQTKVICGEI